MSEDKARYTPGDTITVGSQETIEAIPSRLPTLLAQMVNEYSETLNTVFVTNDEAVILQFNRTLLDAALPALQQYFEALANPPLVVKYDPAQDDELDALTKEWARINRSKR